MKRGIASLSGYFKPVPVSWEARVPQVRMHACMLHTVRKDRINKHQSTNLPAELPAAKKEKTVDLASVRHDVHISPDM